MMFYMAMRYNDPQCESTKEFECDIKRLKYVKRLFNSYIQTGELKTRLIVNHLIVLANVFGQFPLTRIMLYKISPTEHDILTTFLYELGIIRRDMLILNKDVQQLIQQDMI